MVISDGVATNPAKVETVEKWPTPPVNPQKSEFPLTEHCQAAFDQQKGLLTRAPILAHPKDDRDFLLDTDDSWCFQGNIKVLS